MLQGKAFTSTMPEASALKEPLRALPPPNIASSGLSALRGVSSLSLPPKSDVMSMSTRPGLWATTLKAFSTGSEKLVLNAAAMGSVGRTTAACCTLYIYTFVLSVAKRTSSGVLTICPATKSWVLLVRAMRLLRM